MSELLLPVGNIQMCLAAIHNGANAIYVGMPGFNARGRSHDHEMESLKEIIDMCHLYGVHVHIAFNILIFQNEISAALEKLDEVIALGPDAFIVQDLGLISLMKKRYPDITIHASTQMTVTNFEAIELVEDLGIKRFVLGRENTLDEIKKIKEKTNKELEVFVHGALCVAYSGQCFTSEALGGRSANRGQCAQSCRFNYELYVDNEKKNLKNLEYLVSPQDLCGLAEIPKLIELGVESFKVEGRLKSPEFVATAAKEYSDAINNKLQDLQKSKRNLATSFSRGFYSGWLNGVAHQELVRGDYKSHRGHYLGKITRVNKKTLTVDCSEEINAGDGVLIVTSKNQEIGGKVFAAKTIGTNLFIDLPNGLDLTHVTPGCDIYLNSSDALKKDVHQSYEVRERKKRIPISIKALAELNSPLKLTVSDGINTFELKSDSMLEAAKNAGISTQSLTSQLGKLSHTPYILESISFNTSEALFISNQELKELKNQLIEKLNLARTQVTPPKRSEIDVLPKSYGQKNSSSSAKLNLLVRNIYQLKTVCDEFRNASFINKIILDYEFGKDYFDSVKIAREAGFVVYIATTRVLKPFEYHNFRLIERCAPDGLLIRNLGALNYFQKSDFKLMGDFSLNCANSETFNYLKTKGLETLCASYDLNILQLNDLINSVNSKDLEVTIHQYMPEFHMEHCVFAAFLSKGNSFRDCGKPCEKHEVYLKDMYGNRHEIKADQECRNTMYKAEVSSTIKYISQWQENGVSNFRFECLHESGAELIKKLTIYKDLFSNIINTDEAYQRLGAAENYGLSVGQLSNTRTFKDRKKGLHHQ